MLLPKWRFLWAMLLARSALGFSGRLAPRVAGARSSAVFRRAISEGVVEEERYKNTVILPETSFSQRANAVKREPEIQAYWQEKRVYEKLWEKATGEPFTLHDGPPYANGDLHIGHALNKILKDIINKFHTLKGRKVRYVPGWDCHGLPIELKVLQTLKKDEKKDLTPPKLREKARDFAVETVGRQKESFMRYGVWGDWEDPYLTLKPEYEAAQIGVFGDMVEKGHIYRGRKPVHWSPSSRTALAEAELEYPEGHKSKSVYAAFPVKDTETLPASLKPFVADGNKLGVGIWTTTPWTLPANMAVAVNEKLEYAVVELPDGWQESAGVQKGKDTPTHVLCATDLVPSLAKAIGMDEGLPIQHTLLGAEISGKVSYTHPFIDRESPIVTGGDYITTESGTGMVHTAPGHGQEDYLTGLKYNLEPLSPVDDAGRFTGEAEEGLLEGFSLAGLSVVGDGNDKCIEITNSTGALLRMEPYEHKYPYDWRTKKPTIFRATDQWFASVESFRDDALKAIESVKWVPGVGQNRITSFVSGRSEWCISRQRTWGVPIPVFYHKETGEPLLTGETIKHVQDVFREHGSDAWFTMDVKDLLPAHMAAEADQYEPGRDTMDVWFDSGTSWAGVAEARGTLTYPVDLYLEGSDQHRGWFQSSLLTSIATRGQAPYKSVLTHGFVMDEKGRKMSKSLGNVVLPTQVIDGGKDKKKQPPYGADALRMWVASVDYTTDVSIGDNIIKQTFDNYRKIRNTFRYLIGSVSDFPADEATSALGEKLAEQDKYILNKLQALLVDVNEAYEQCQFQRVVQSVLQFMIADLSNFYLESAKDRMYISSRASDRRRTCQYTMQIVLKSLAVAIAPILPHLAEDIFLNLDERPADMESIFQLYWPSTESPWETKASMDTWDGFLKLKDDVNMALAKAREGKTIGAALDAKVTIVIPDAAKETDVAKFVQAANGAGNMVDELKHLLVCSQAEAVEGGAEMLEGAEYVMTFAEGASPFGVVVRPADGTKCARCWHYSETVGDSERFPGACDKCVDALEADGHDV